MHRQRAWGHPHGHTALSAALNTTLGTALLGMLCAASFGVAAQVQPRPDAGTLQEPQRLLPSLPQPGAPRLNLPEATPPKAPAASARIIPTAFRFQGNTVFAEPVLAQLLASRINQPTDLAGLQEAARQVKAYYQDRGYLLTDVYLPEQALKAEGGPVTLAVVEARVGQVTVRAAGDRVSAPAAQALVRQQLQPGDPITEYALDRPVLLLRDLTGYDATATVEPGAQTGQANVVIDVRATGKPFEASIGLDNHGTRAAGQIRAFATLDANNPSGRGDALQARVQMADISATRLFRLSYSLSPLGATRASLTAARTEYALGRQFAALGATGRADIFSAALLHPLVRSRNRNYYLALGLDHKQLRDETLASPATDRRIVSAHAGVLGNFFDDTAAGAFTSFAANATAGTVRMDAASQATDQGAGGPRTAGQFGKLNIEAQRTQFFAGRLSLQASLQAQFASKNLASAEKMSLGGPTGVRGYPVGEGIGDSGAVFNLEARYQLPPTLSLAGEPVSVTAFYDLGTVKLNQDGAAGVSNRQTLDSAGVGLFAGRAGNYLLSASLAWRIGSTLPSGGEPDRNPRFWLTTQKWF